MEVNLMRKIDYWLGIPICFILSLFYRLEKLLGLRRIEEGRPKKILYIELSEMGSTVLAYSAMKKSKELFPGAELYFLIFKENQESVKLLGIIPEKNILTITSKNFLELARDTLKIIYCLRKEKIDFSVDLELFSRFTTILSFLSGAKERAGFYQFYNEGLYRGNLQTVNVIYNAHRHISQNFLALVCSLKESDGQVPLLKKRIDFEEAVVPSLKSGEAERENIWRKLKRLNPKINKEDKIIILNPNASNMLPLRRWALDKYAQLAKNIFRDNPDYYIVITGTLSEKNEAREICRMVEDPRCLDFTGETTFKELIDLYNISQVMISNDSGPPHFAAMTPLKIIVLFGPETPNLYGPLSKNIKFVYANYFCSPCVSAYNHRHTPCRDNKCLQAISVDDVYSALSGFLEK